MLRSDEMQPLCGFTPETPEPRSAVRTLGINLQQFRNRKVRIVARCSSPCGISQLYVRNAIRNEMVSDPRTTDPLLIG